MCSWGWTENPQAGRTGQRYTIPSPIVKNGDLELTSAIDFSQDKMDSLVWTANYIEPFDFKTQTYKGQPVLTFWSGELLNGFGRGSYYILNQSYVEIAHFQANRFGNDMGDIHEFTITNDDTALVPIYHTISWDLTETGGLCLPSSMTRAG